jgi:L-rhamnose-H+ transport protein
VNSTLTGIAALIVAGVTNASFTIPMKYTRKWAWENTWMVWTVFALVLLPLAVAVITVPNLSAVYRSAGSGTVLRVCGFGAGWGVAQVCFGLAVEMIGVTLAFSIVLGTSAAVGSLVPMVSLHRDNLDTGAGFAVLGAIAFVVIGVVVCAVAGRMRDESNARSSTSDSQTSQGLLLAFVCGIAASFMNLGVAFGTPLIETARSLGAYQFNATNAVWLPLMLAGAVPNVMYCAWLMQRNHSADKFRVGRSHWALAAGMACLWFGSTLLYGVAAWHLGSWGPILGWPFFMSLIVITATTLGIFTGEWKNSGTLPIRIQWTGVTVLVLAVFILAGSSRYIH